MPPACAGPAAGVSKREFAALTPVEQYFVRERAMLAGAPKDVAQQNARALALIAQQRPVLRVRAAALAAPELFFQAVLLQAVHIYGGKTTDYKLVY